MRPRFSRRVMRHPKSVLQLAFMSMALLGPFGLKAEEPATTQAETPGDETLTITLADNTRLKVLIDYVSERLGVQFLCDEQIAQQVVSIKQGVTIPRRTLLNFLQVVLQSKGFTITESSQPGWKKIIPASQMIANAKPVLGATTRSVEGAVTQVFHLQNIDSARIDVLFKPFLSQPGGSSISMPEQRLLIVTDYAANVARIGSLIAMIDRSSRPVVSEFVPLEHGEAADVAGRLGALMQASLTSAPASGKTSDLEVGYDARTNQIALVGERQRVDEAKQFIKQFDAPLALTFKSYQFKYASPERADKLVKQMYSPEVLKRSYQAGVDKEGRLLLVTTTPEIHARIEAVKHDIDVALAATESPVQFYKLSNTSAKDVLKTLRGIRGEDAGSGSEETGYGDLEEQGPGTGFSPSGTRTVGASGQTFGSARGTNRELKPSSLMSGAEASIARGGNVGGSGAATRPTATDGGGGLSLRTDDALITADVNTNSIIVVADPTVQKMYERLIQSLDKRRPQVLVECKLVILDTSRNFSYGVDIGRVGGFGSSDIITFSNFGIGRPQTSTGGIATGRLALTPGAAGFNGALLSADIADIVVNALLTTNRAKVVSAPKILVNDNATGTLRSTLQQPYSSINIGNTISTTSFGSYVDAGTTINLTPHISDANYLQLEYEVSLNQFIGASVNGSPPPRKTNDLSSTVTIPDGSTIIIGGLTSFNFSDSVSTIPIIGEIPVIRELLGTHRTDNAETTLFVFIRPVILRDDRFQDLKYLSERDVKVAGVATDDLVSEPLTLQ